MKSIPNPAKPMKPKPNPMKTNETHTTPTKNQPMPNTKKTTKNKIQAKRCLNKFVTFWRLLKSYNKVTEKVPEKFQKGPNGSVGLLFVLLGTFLFFATFQKSSKSTQFDFLATFWLILNFHRKGMFGRTSGSKTDWRVTPRVALKVALR